MAEDGAEFMIASHNQASVERAVALMHERGLNHRTAGVFFGQLLGMADFLSFVLGANGYRVGLPLIDQVHLLHAASPIRSLIWAGMIASQQVGWVFRTLWSGLCMHPEPQAIKKRLLTWLWCRRTSMFLLGRWRR